MTKKTRQRSSSEHPVTAYARSVGEGKTLAGPHVIGTCKRHLSDLERDDVYFDEEASNRAIEFFRVVLRLNGGEFEGLPFELLDWQLFIVGALFGWKSPDGYRRFRMAFIETAKGSGKSPLAAGVGLYMLTADQEPRAEVYAAASKHDQAKVLFRDAVAMVQQSPDLDERLDMSGGIDKHNIAYVSKGSFFRPISSEREGKGQSGPRPHCALLDEIHEHPTNAMVEFMRAGTKGRRQALIFMITNSGSDRESVCYDYHQYAIKIASGQVEDDSFFSYVCALDEGDDPFEDESCWGKANPSLGITFDHKYLREQVQHAKGMPSKQNIVLRLNFCMWTDADSAWMGADQWMACEDELDLSGYAGMECYGGLDMSYTTDLSAFAVVFPVGEDTYHAFVDFWKPRDGLREAAARDGANYDKWVNSGELRLTEGKVIKLGPIAQRMAEIADLCSLQSIAYDAYRHKELQDDMLDLGIELPLIEHPQGFRRTKDNPLWMPKSFQETENMILEGRLKVNRSECLRWNVSSVVVRQDPAGTDNRIFDKRKSLSRVDGVVALAMAIGNATSGESMPVSPWEDPSFSLRTA